MAVPETEERDEDTSDKPVNESIEDGVDEAIEGNVASKEDVKEAFQSDC